MSDFDWGSGFYIRRCCHVEDVNQFQDGPGAGCHCPFDGIEPPSNRIERCAQDCLLSVDSGVTERGTRVCSESGDLRFKQLLCTELKPIVHVRDTGWRAVDSSA